MKLIGRRTYIVCIVIAALAAVQKFLGVQIPQEIWIALFALAVAATRSAVGAAKLIVLLLVPFALLCGGCAGPAPVPVKSGVSILCWYNPRTYVTYAACPTNAPASSESSVRDTSTSQPVQPVQNGGVSIAIDNLTTLTCGGGTAASNTVPVSFSFNKQ